MKRRMRGQQNVLNNLAREIRKIEGATVRGLAKAALLVKREAMKMTPVDTGNLKASTYTKQWMSARGPRARIGYRAKYALWVHEASGKLAGKPRPRRGGKGRGLYWDPQGKARPQFLRTALRMNEQRILDIIKKYARV